MKVYRDAITGKFVTQDYADANPDTTVSHEIEAADNIDTDGIDVIASLAHAVNRAYCEFLGDTSQAMWTHAPEWQRESVRNGVRALLANPSLSPEQMHQKWWDEKRAQGWVYGPNKDAELKTHPCCVPYAELPAEQRAKDYLFRGVVLGFIEQGLDR